MRKTKQEHLSTTWLYLMHAEGTDRYKIGISDDPRDRRNKLQVGCPFELKLLVIVEDCGEAEAILHEHYRKAHIHGEWFRFTNHDKIVREISEVTGPRVRCTSDLVPIIMSHNDPPSNLKAHQYGIKIAAPEVDPIEEQRLREERYRSLRLMAHKTARDNGLSWLPEYREEWVNAKRRCNAEY